MATVARSDAAPRDSIAGDALLRRVLAAVDAQPSLAARLRYQVNLMGRSAVGSGVYLQQGRGPERLLRFELTLETPPITSRVLHVANGADLWVVEELAGENKLSRVDVARLRNARPTSPGGVVDPNGWLALGGLSRLLGNLDAAFRFGPVSESRLDDVRVWTLVGQWDHGRLGDLLPDQKEAIHAGAMVDYGKLPQRLPTAVVLHVGCDDFLPYRIEYWRNQQPRAGDFLSGRDALGQLLVVMELYEVRIGHPIDPAQFVFQPPEGQKPQDRTAEFLTRLGLEEAPTAGARRPTPPRR
ncbi:MAG: hypothetical protein WD845_06645 [Pirellulales bacterium]